MKIVLIQPKSFHTWEALNLGYIASFLRLYGFDRLRFYSAFFDPEEEIIDACAQGDIVGFTCTSPHVKNAVALATAIKKENPGVWTVMGGVHPSAVPSEALEFNVIDQVVVGEGEMAMVSIAKGNRDRIVNATPISDIDRIPPPDRVFIRQERNVMEAFRDNGIRIGSIFSSRGCPFFCTFCASHSVWGRKVRFRSAKNILDEFCSIVEDLKLDLVKFADDTFTLKRDLVEDFCVQKIRHGVETPWACNIRVDTVDRSLLELMWEAGCREVWAGVESGAPKLLLDMKKKITLEQIRRVFAWTKDIGFFRRAYILLGMPREGWEDIRLTDELIEEIAPDAVGFSILAPYPGTAHYNPELHKHVDWSQVDEYENHIWHTTHLTNEDLVNVQQGLINKYRSKLVFRLKDRLSSSAAN